MKRICVVFTLLLVVAIGIIMAYGSSKGELEKVTLKVEGITTPCCIPRVEEAC